MNFSMNLQMHVFDLDSRTWRLGNARYGNQAKRSLYGHTATYYKSWNSIIILGGINVTSYQWVAAYVNFKLYFHFVKFSKKFLDTVKSEFSISKMGFEKRLMRKFTWASISIFFSDS